MVACDGGDKGNSFGEYVPEESVACVTHECTKMRAKAATCEQEGNIEYWSCYRCEKLFTDSSATQELSARDVVVPKLSHW